MAKDSWKVYWNDYSHSTYLYGSEIKYNGKDNVEFVNLLMPPGTIIKRWYSRVNYQRMRVEPELPLIDGESTYHISVDISSAKPKGHIVKIVFFDRYEAEAGSVIVDGTEMDFRCPLKTYSYEVQIINVGTTGFIFHSFTISEIS